jgi:NADH-quinone oxidoreductase subunit A
VAKAVRVRVSPSAPAEFEGQQKSVWSVLKRLLSGFFVSRSSFNLFLQIVNLENYFPVLLFILVGIGVGVLPQVLGRVLAPHKPDAQKLSPYECGFEAFEDARMKFDVRYYLVAILFILFDLEVAFLVPWSVAMREVGMFGFWSMMIFLGVLTIGLVFEWKKGALDWE